MKPFGYLRATSIEEAVRAAAGQPGARFLGGGTNLVDLMKLGVEAPRLLIDVTRLPLADIEELPDGGLRIGAMVRNSDLAAAVPVRERYPVLSQALLAGASGQLRNTATTGGNLLQRTRCLYFQDITKPCNKRSPGTGCPARDGVHRDLAVLGHSAHCVATQPSDLAVALAALDAEVQLHGPDGERTVAVTDFHRLPGDRPEQDTVIRPGELITSVLLPPVPTGASSRYRKARDRASDTYMLASVAAMVHVEHGVVKHIAVAFGGLAHRPWRARHTEAALLGTKPTTETVEQAVEAELATAVPLRHNAYKVELTRAMAREVLDSMTVGHRKA